MACCLLTRGVLFNQREALSYSDARGGLSGAFLWVIDLTKRTFSDFP
jgi:hypothetical protein